MASIAISNLVQCSQAMTLEVKISEVFMNSLVKRSKCNLLQVEDLLLQLTLSEIVDGIYHHILLKVLIKDEIIYYSRFFEYGAFEGFHDARAKDLLKNRLEIDDDILSIRSFTSMDMKENKKRNNKRKEENSSGKFCVVCVYRF